MIVVYTDRSKDIITLSEKPIADGIIEELSDYSIEADMQMIVRTAVGTNDTFEILKFTAEIAKNSRIWNAYGANDGETKNLDVWMELYAYNKFVGFYEIGCYLTDIWQITGDNSEEIRNHFYINKFTKRG